MNEHPERPMMRLERMPAASPAAISGNGASPHLSDEQLAAWMGDELSEDGWRAVRHHLSSCRYCQEALAQAQHIQALTRAANKSVAHLRAGGSLVDAVLARLPEPPRTSTPTNEMYGMPEPRLPSSRRKQRRDIWRRVGALAAVLVLIASSALLFTRLSSRSQAIKPTPTATATATPSEMDNLTGTWAKAAPAQSTILDVAVVSQNDIWAAGLAGTDHGIQTLLMHFDGARWQVSPDIFDGAQLYSISMVSSTDGWASGSRDGSPLMLHYKNGHWVDATATIEIAALKDHKIHLTQVRMATATAGWALGQGDQQPQGTTQVLQYMKVGATYRWEPTQSFLGGVLSALSVVSDHEAWVVGHFDQQTLIARITVTYQNNDPNSTITGWSTHSWENLGNGALTSIGMRSSTDGWAGGADSDGTGLVFHWDGSQWQQVGLPPLTPHERTIQGIVAIGANAAWVYGELPSTHSSFLYSVTGNHWLDYQFSPAMDTHLVTGAATSSQILLAITDGATDYGANPTPKVYDLRQGVPLPTS